MPHFSPHWLRTHEEHSIAGPLSCPRVNHCSFSSSCATLWGNPSLTKSGAVWLDWRTSVTVCFCLKLQLLLSQSWSSENLMTFWWGSLLLPVCRPSWMIIWPNIYNVIWQNICNIIWPIICDVFRAERPSGPRRMLGKRKGKGEFCREDQWFSKETLYKVIWTLLDKYPLIWLY